MAGIKFKTRKFKPEDIIRFKNIIKDEFESSFKTPAKINLSLKIGKKESNGMHKVLTLMRAIKIYDDINLCFNKCKQIGQSIYFNMEPGEILKKSGKDFDLKSINNEENTAVKATRIFLEKIGVEDYDLSISITKNIPLMAGLGGGSSNAAGMLSMLNRKFQYPFSAKELQQIALEIGSDVTFFLTAGKAVVSGFGEEIHEINDETLPDYYIVLLIPDFGISTKEAFADFDDFLLTNNTNYYNIQFLDFKKLNYENDFESVIFKKYSILKEIKDSMILEGAEISLLSGSGSTIFGAFKTEDSAKSYLNKLESFSFGNRIILNYLTTTV